MDFDHLFNSDRLKEKYLKLQKLKKRQKALQDRVGQSLPTTASNRNDSTVNTRSKRKNPFLK